MSVNQEHNEMLTFLKIKDKNDLFSDVPQNVRKKALNMNRGISEYELLEEARSYSLMNRGPGMANFLGNGLYDRVIPTSIDSLIGRTEFLTSYTPYQAEMSQGVLQSLFEYQSLMCQLTGMDVTNSSMYDGYTALGEAVRMAYRVNEKTEILLPETIYNGKLEVIRSYLAGIHIKLLFYKVDMKSGHIDLDDIRSRVNGNTCAIVCEQPNGLGIIDENVFKLQEIKKEALLIAYVDPISLGIIREPGSYGADIVVAEGQQLGIHKSFGGPLLGILSFKNDYIRRSPGRIIGESVDANGKRAFVMTLQTREQHIRREKAMSNICTNQALMAIAAASYLSIVGVEGLRKVATITYQNSKKLRSSLSKTGKLSKGQLTGKPFSDVLVSFASPVEKLSDKLFDRDILGGVPLARFLSHGKGEVIPNSHFFSVTEKTQEREIEQLVKALEVIS